MTRQTLAVEKKIKTYILACRRSGLVYLSLSHCNLDQPVLTAVYNKWKSGRIEACPNTGSALIDNFRKFIKPQFEGLFTWSVDGENELW